MMAAWNVGLGILLAWGEWKSKVFLAYIPEDSLESKAFGESTLKAEESEGEELLAQQHQLPMDEPVGTVWGFTQSQTQPKISIS